MNINAIQPDGPTIAIEHQATGETPVHVTPGKPDFSFRPPIQAIRVKSCGNDWVTDTDTTRTADQIRGLSLDSDGVHLYLREKDIHGSYDNVFVPWSNLEALVFYFRQEAE